ncbi:unnamed protein product [Eruca vesicaria subsp. sativa]|uniref:Uncharacterized protein n=1 Tax=Eruca vesicaria subsp. sativa TaxID=29727 RepID=A0ABC8K1M8_ERUVS|nr:unnamed protein product [Eruca vesicaria subsp. sativa]
MSNGENRGSSSFPPAKRVKMINNIKPAPLIFTSTIADYKLLVRSLTCILPSSSGQTSLRVQAQAHVSNHRASRLYGAPLPPPRNRFRGSQWMSSATSRSFANPFPPSSSAAGPSNAQASSSAAGPSNAQASSSRPPLPPLSTQAPLSVPTSVWGPTSAPLVSARLLTLPPSSPPPPPPPPPQDQGSMEPRLAARMQSFERLLNEDDDHYYFPASSVAGTSDVAVPQNGFMTPTWEHSLSSLFEDVAPQNGLGSSSVPPPATSQNNLPSGNGLLPANFPSGSQEEWVNYQNIVSSGNADPPPVAPAGANHPEDQQGRDGLLEYTTSLPNESELGWPNPQNGLQQGTTVPEYGSLSNYTYEEMEQYLQLTASGSVLPSWELD